MILAFRPTGKASLHRSPERNPFMDFTAAQEIAATITADILAFPMLLETVIGVVTLAPFVAATFTTLGLSS